MTKLELKIIYEDDNLVAVNKPSGLLSIPDRFDAKIPSLKNILAEKYGDIFVIHRIDRDTSGIILFARNEDAHRYYSMAFEERKIAKKYLGLVHGTPSPASGTIDKPIAHHPVLKGKMVVHKNGKPSVTHYRTLDSFGLFSIVEFEIETGRTHQIRVHMQDKGNPIACDPLYGTAEPIFLSRIKRNFKMSKNQEVEIPMLNRLALHAHSLEFKTPSGNTVKLEAELFKDMQATLTQLRKNSK
ncbi:MAG TPA: RluA family pseudouridine synthase [Chitinophagaceae bacterium]|nr:RluA family pseudouridine synthase [Chitinophagaceae bacterium]